jgi:hypothetical protein
MEVTARSLIVRWSRDSDVMTSVCVFIFVKPKSVACGRCGSKFIHSLASFFMELLAVRARQSNAASVVFSGIGRGCSTVQEVQLLCCAHSCLCRLLHRVSVTSLRSNTRTEAATHRATPSSPVLNHTPLSHWHVLIQSSSPSLPRSPCIALLRG